MGKIEKQLGEAIKKLRKAETNLLLFPGDKEAQALVGLRTKELEALRQALTRALPRRKKS